MPHVVKLNLDGDLRRVELAEPTLRALRRAVKAQFPKLRLREWRLCVPDEDGDMVTLGSDAQLAQAAAAVAVPAAAAAAGGAGAPAAAGRAFKVDLLPRTSAAAAAVGEF